MSEYSTSPVNLLRRSLISQFSHLFFAPHAAGEIGFGLMDAEFRAWKFHTAS